MRVTWSAAFVKVLPVRGRIGGELEAYATHGRVSPAMALLRIAAVDLVPAAGRLRGQSQARAAADAADGHWRRSTRGRGPAIRIRSIAFTPICCGTWWFRGPTKYGARTSPTCPCRTVSCIWLQFWIGTADTYWRGGCRTRWTATSAWRPCGRLTPRSAGDLQHRSRDAVHQPGFHRRAGVAGHRHQHGRPPAGVGQRVHRAAVVEREIRGRVPAGLRDGAGTRIGTAKLLRVLQPTAAAPGLGESHAVGGVLGPSAVEKTTKVAALKFWPAARLWRERLLAKIP